jgi:hypothetical protein
MIKHKSQIIFIALVSCQLILWAGCAADTVNKFVTVSFFIGDGCVAFQEVAVQALRSLLRDVAIGSYVATHVTQSYNC